MLVKKKDIGSQISKVCKVKDLNELKTTVESDFSTQGNVNFYWGKENRKPLILYCYYVAVFI